MGEGDGGIGSQMVRVVVGKKIERKEGGGCPLYVAQGIATMPYSVIESGRLSLS